MHRPNERSSYTTLAGALLLGLLGASALLHAERTVASYSNPPSLLIRLDLPNLAAVRDFAQRNVNIYAQLYTDSGEVVLILPMDAVQFHSLVQERYPVQILASDFQEQLLYLLYGQPDVLQKAATVVDLFFIEGQNAVAQCDAQQLAFVESLGIMSTPVPVHPLMAPQPEVTSKSLTQANLVYVPLIQQMIDQVSTTALEDFIKDMSGERSVLIGGEPYTLDTRFTLTEVPINKATLYVRDYMQSLGLTTDFEYYQFYQPNPTYEKRNVIAEQPGTTQPEQIILLTAHLDSRSQNHTSSMTDAPGADDNASGSAALLQIAQILSQYDFGCTLRYALFTGEEQGLLGSRDYATLVNQKNENIAAVLNLDMLGYNTPGSARIIELHTRQTTQTGYEFDLAIANLFSDTISTYGIDLIPEIVMDGIYGSDHNPFWDGGYAAILAIEDYYGDKTPSYHRITDTVSTLDLSYYTDYVKAALATFAHMGCLPDEQCVPIIEPEIQFSPAHPNVAETVYFTGTVSAGSAPISYSWDFVDGYGANETVVTHTFASPGFFEIELTTENACTNPISITQQIFIGKSRFWFPLLWGGDQIP